MRSFCAVFNYSNRADGEKDKSNYRFPSIVKNNGQEGLKLSKVGRENWLAQIFSKILTRTSIKIMLSASPSLFFFQTKFTISDLKKQILILS